MLGVKKTKFIHTLIDMLELDTSEQVRTMVSVKSDFFKENQQIKFWFNLITF